MSSDKPCCPCLVQKVAKALRLPKPPLFIVAVPMVGTCVLALVGARILHARFAFSDSPRLAPVQDMGSQPKFRAQASSVMFADGRAMRAPVAGTVAHGSYATAGRAADANLLKNDDHFFRGYRTDDKGEAVVKEEGGQKKLDYLGGYPAALKVDAALLHIGRDKYAQNCAMCHGLDGSGKGPVDAVASKLPAATGTTWTGPANLTQPKYLAANGYSNGELFHVLNHGRANMAGLGASLGERDGWAIVAYVRALQRSQNANGK